jgi:hypothetical protein
LRPSSVRVLELIERGASRDEIIATLARSPVVGPLRAPDVYERAMLELSESGHLSASRSPSLTLAALASRGARRSYPWYDSVWLGRWMGTRELARAELPAGDRELLDGAQPLRTDLSFATRDLGVITDDTTLGQMRALVRELDAGAIEYHEGEQFGRTLVHNHPFFNEMHQSMLQLASEAAGEELEPSYNFLSLYTSRGLCAPHMDAPSAKYTLDLCIEQSDPWPIYISQVVPWPEHYTYGGEDWAERIMNDPELRFEEYILEPGQAIFFSGSSQWHYRNRHPGNKEGFCNLIFFHFIPKGTRDFVRLFDPYLT